MITQMAATETSGKTRFSAPRRAPSHTLTATPRATGTITMRKIDAIMPGTFTSTARPT